jgi:hypothetical protein
MQMHSDSEAARVQQALGAVLESEERNRRSPGENKGLAQRRETVTNSLIPIEL